MPDLVQNPTAQMMDTSNPVGEQQQQFQNQPLPQSQGQDGHPVGTMQDARDQQDPFTSQQQASPEEQAQYTQLINRFLLMLSDPRKTGAGVSPREAAFKQLNNPKLSIPQAVGYTTAQLMFILHESALHQKVKYDNDVLFHAADACIAATYLLGLARGIFKGVPPFKGTPGEGESYAFEKQDLGIIAQAKLHAVQKFGALLQAHGEISEQDRAAATEFWKKQINYEVRSGRVDPALIEALKKNPKVAAELNAFGAQQPGQLSDSAPSPQEGT